MSNDAPYIQWHVDAYLGDTGHLSCVEHGAYTQTLWACWKRGGEVPERHIQRLVGMTDGEWSESRDTLAEFFEVEDGVWRHHRIAAEIDRIEARREAASAAGKASADRRQAAKKTAPKATAGTTPVEQPRNEGSTTVERPFNDRSTEAQRTPNHEDVDVEKDVDVGSLPSVENEMSPRTGAGVPERPAIYLDHLRSHHGYGPRVSAMDNRALQQAMRWQNEHVTLAEVDHAVEVARAALLADGDERDPPVRYLAECIATARRPAKPARARKLAAPKETAAEYGLRIARELGMPTADDPAVVAVERPLLEASR